jgi:hypothetical protein
MTEARLLLFDRPRVEVRLSGELPAWLVLELPPPTAEPRPQGVFRIDPRVPESEVTLEWAAATGPGVTRVLLTVTAAGRSWVLEPDPRAPGRWRLNDADGHRFWS